MKEEQIYLSRRNLLTLLSKLDRAKKGEETFCTIIKQNSPNSKCPQNLDVCVVTAVEDEEYYKDRKPGPMHPLDDPSSK